MQHRFYQRSKVDQIKIIFVVVGLLSVMLFGFVLISWGVKMYWIAFLAFPILLSVAAPFIDTPSLVKSGKLIYCSNLFLMEKPKNGAITIHGGTLFDYVFVLNQTMSGNQRTRYILQQYFEGLLFLIEEYEAGKLENYRVKGTTYLLNRRTAKKIGFEITRTDVLQQIILIYNFLNILISNSIAKKKFAIPNLCNTASFRTRLSELATHKQIIEKWNHKLKI